MERLTGNDNKFFQDGMDEHKVSAVYFKLKAYEDAEEQGLLVRLHEGTTFSQIRAIMKLCERINGAKARKGQETEPLITWQLYNILCKTFRVDDEAEKALEEANRNG